MKEGYFILAKAFYETMKANSFISNKWTSNDVMEQERNVGVTELDSVCAAMNVHHLKGSWPFQPKGLPNNFGRNFHPSNLLEEISFRTLSTKNYKLILGHYDLGEYYEKRGELDKAFAEYMAQIATIPHEPDFYRSAATVLIKQNKFEEASRLLRKSLQYKESLFANKWIGQIAFMYKNNKEAILFLRKADMNDSQVLFNLSRAYYADHQWVMGEEYFQRLMRLSPHSEYAVYLSKLRAIEQFKNRMPDSR